MSAAAEVIPVGGADPLSEPSLARDLAQRFLVWDAFVGGRRRVDVHPLLLPADLHTQAVRAAEEVVRAVGTVAARAHDDEAERARYGFEDDVVRLAAASRAAGDDASLMRVDLLLDGAGEWKACEINADCPGGHNESLGLPRLARSAGFRQGTIRRASSRRSSSACAGSPTAASWASSTRPRTPRTSRSARSSRASSSARHARDPRAADRPAPARRGSLHPRRAGARALPVLPDGVDERPATTSPTSRRAVESSASAR